ncbi:MAG: hypothetical protein AB1324_00285 [Candidatus Micrarchaeota archaeon]
MAIRRELLLILALILIIAVLVKLIEFFQVNVVESDASNFVLEDLQNKYPGADTEIMTIEQKTNPSGAKYFEVKARVTEDPGGPCPERTHIFYNYPAQNFIPQLPEAITRNCAVCTEGLCTIAFPEEAIIASHTFPGTADVSSYLRAYPSAVPTVTELADSWMIKWDDKDADHYFVMEIHREGSVLEVKKIGKA